jgi:hypothetical protein
MHIARRRSAICWTSNDDGGSISDNTLNKAPRIMGCDPGGDHRAHGYRSTASACSTAMQRNPNLPTTWRQKRRPRDEVVRRQLDNGDQNRIRSVSNRAAYWTERVRLMQHWSDCLDSLRDGAPAVSLPRSAA